MPVLELTQQNLDTIVSSNDTVILDFWAPWCEPCKGFAPIFEAVSEKFPGVVFAKINTEQEIDLADTFQIRSIPTIMVLRQQVILFSQPGAMAGAALEQIIQGALEIDMVEVHRQIAEDAGEDHTL